MGVQQTSIFEFLYETYQPNKIRLYQFFAGVGSQAKALKNLGVEFEDYKIVEWAVPSIKAYNHIHTKDFTDYSQGKTRDEMIQVVKNVSLDYDKPITEKQLNSKSDEWIKEVYNHIVATHNLVNIMEVHGKDLEIDTNYTNIIFYSFPCQDLSKAGLKAGLQKEGGTRSGLLWEVERIINELTDEERASCVLICENVPDLVEVNFVKDFSKWVSVLENLGYTSYDQILNAKDYGIPQNRKRVFMVSLPGAYSYTFPRRMPLQYRLKDFLEKHVDKKFYLSQKMLNGMITTKFHQYQLQNRLQDGNSIIDTLTTRTGEGCPHVVNADELQKVGNYGNGHHAKDIYDANGSAPTITTGNHGLGQTIAIKNNNSQGYALAEEGDGLYLFQSDRFGGTKAEKQVATTIKANKVDAGVVINDKPIDEVKLVGGIGEKTSNSGSQWFEQRRIYDGNGLATVVTTDKACHPFYAANLRVRKLTPKECMRLMGFDDVDTDAMKCGGMTDSQIYHCAGDSIVVSVLMGIFGTLLGVEDYEQRITELTNRLAEK